MSQVMRMGAAAAALLALLLFHGNVAADDGVEIKAVVPDVPTEAAKPAPIVRAFLGIRPLDSKVLGRKRAGTDVFNDAQLRGGVTNNSAVNVTTGNNVIRDGAFSGQSGIPLVVQNSGNNVLIQNATIINLQVK